MARPIKETPILHGKAARRFEALMKQNRKESDKEREQRIKDYEDCMAMLEAGKDVKMATERNG